MSLCLLAPGGTGRSNVPRKKVTLTYWVKTWNDRNQPWPAMPYNDTKAAPMALRIFESQCKTTFATQSVTSRPPPHLGWVRFTARSGHRELASTCRFVPKGGLTHRGKPAHCDSIISSSGTEVCTCALTCPQRQPEYLPCSRKSRLIERRRKSSLVSRLLRNRFGTVANTGNLLRCIGRSRSAKNQAAPSP